MIGKLVNYQGRVCEVVDESVLRKAVKLLRVGFIPVEGEWGSCRFNDVVALADIEVERKRMRKEYVSIINKLESKFAEWTGKDMTYVGDDFIGETLNIWKCGERELVEIASFKMIFKRQRPEFIPAEYTRIATREEAKRDMLYYKGRIEDMMRNDEAVCDRWLGMVNG